MTNVLIFLKSSPNLVATQGDKLKSWLAEEQVVFKMDVKIKKKNRKERNQTAKKSRLPFEKAYKADSFNTLRIKKTDLFEDNS